MPEDGFSMWNINLPHGCVAKQVVYCRGLGTVLVRYTCGHLAGPPLYIFGIYDFKINLAFKNVFYTVTMLVVKDRLPVTLSH